MQSTIEDGTIVINQLGIIQSFNLYSECIFGYVADEVIGKNINILMITQDYLKKYLETGKKNIIDNLSRVDGVKKDGTQISILLSVTDFRLNGDLLFVVIIRCIEDEDEDKVEDDDKAYHNRLYENLQEMKTLTQQLKQGSQQWVN